MVGGVAVVTILILIDGFLQLQKWMNYVLMVLRHNPYFNRWFSAIKTDTINMRLPIKSQSLF